MVGLCPLVVSKMKFAVHCYFLKEGSHISVSHELQEVEIQPDGSLPKFLSIKYDAALHDDEVRRKFDPRANWDQWTSGANPFTRTVELEYLPALGLTYLQNCMVAVALKLFPQFKVQLPEDKIYKMTPAFENIFNEPFDSHWADGLLGQTVRFPKKQKGPDTYVWKK